MSLLEEQSDVAAHGEVDATAALVPSTSSSVQASPSMYESHWDRVYREQPSQLAREWHAESAEATRCVERYLRAAREGAQSGGGTVVDLGCGSSTMGMEALTLGGFNRLVLLDCSPTLVTKLACDHAGDPRVAAFAGDVRDLSALVRDEEADCIIDKGTLDALSKEEDKMAMMREMKRILAPDGCIVSVSFPAVARHEFLARETETLGLGWSFRVLAAGDPARGNPAVFLSVLFRQESDAMRGVEWEVDDLTKMLRDRMVRAGSLYEDPVDDEGVVVLDLDREWDAVTGLLTG